MKQAADWTQARREELLAARRGIAFETVFSTTDKVQFLQRAIAADYFVRLFFVGTSDPRINAARVAGRVMAGGHTVPLEKIVSRYYKSMGNLSVAFRLADRVYVYDNSVEGVEAKLLARTTSGAIRKIYAALPEWVESALVGLPRHASFEEVKET